jgi:hypothetical protein
MLRKRLTIAALEGYPVQTTCSIALARFISTWRLFARLSLILRSGIGNGTKKRNIVTRTCTHT